MNLDLIKRIADAVLYEGYVLYPYRPSSVKNRQRFNFGALVPPSYSEAERGTEALSARTECLVEGGPDASVDVTVRFLHLVERDVEGGEAPAWQEALEREVEVHGHDLGGLAEHGRRVAFSFPGLRERELRLDVADAASILRTQAPIEGGVAITAARLGERLFRVTVRIENTTPFANAAAKRRDEALLSSLASAHAVLTARGGAFVSLLDPPGPLREAAAACTNEGLWPVLAGDEGARDAMLASPIILYDYPQIAPESPGDLFDGTEIDEILTLRILTLTDEEKAEIRASDPRARRILERTETLPDDHLRKLHGAVRGLRPVEE